MADQIETGRRAPHIVGIGGSRRAGSVTGYALRLALSFAERLGATSTLLDGDAIDLPSYDPDAPDRSAVTLAFLVAVRRADGVILASPSYHGGITGLVKNAVDHLQDLAGDPSPYLSGRAIGLIATGAGWQGAVTTLAALRTTAHALRGWPTPMGVPINSSESPFDAAGECVAPRVRMQLETIASEVVDFALHRGSAEHRSA